MTTTTLDPSAPATAAPGRPSLPPAVPGAMFEILFTWTTNPLAFLRKARRFGDAFTIPSVIGRMPMVWVSDPAAIRDVFADDGEVMHVREANFIVEGILGSRSMLLLDGAEHRRERRLMMPPFHGERMRAYGETMRDIAASAIEAWPLGAPLSILTEMQGIALDVILRTVFGLDEGPRMTRLRGLLVDLLVYASHPAVFALSLLVPPLRLRAGLSRATDVMADVLGLDLRKAVPGSRLVATMRAVDEELLAELSLRREAKARASAGRAPRTDILELLLDARDDSGQPMSDESLRDELLTLLLAGHETTATTLAWAVHHLLRNPEPLARLRAELDGARLPDGSLPLEGPSSIERLPYLDATVKETMRTTPVVPLVARVLQRDSRIGTLHLPARTMVAPSVYLTHHRPDLYPEPDRFRPERFLERKPAPFEFFPFGGGLRRCLGAAFATYEMKIILGELVSRTRLEPLDAEAKLARRGIMFAPSDGTKVIVRERRPAARA